MSYILPILTPYRYPILAALSLLLIAEMALAAVDLIPGVNLIPIEYEWALGGLMLLTIVAWAGIAMVIGVAPPAGGNLMKHGVRILLVLSPLALFTIIVSPLLFLYPYLLVLIMVWIGIVVTVGIHANTDPITKATSAPSVYRMDASTLAGTPQDEQAERNTKTFLRRGAFPLLVFLIIALFWTFFLLSTTVTDRVWDLLDPVWDLLDSLIGINLKYNVDAPFAALFFVPTTFLVVGAALRRSWLANRPRIVVVLAAVGISVAAFVACIGILAFLYAPIARGIEAPGLALALMVITPVLLSIVGPVFGTILIGTMRRSIRNITVAGIGMAAMILVFGWYWFLTADDGLDAFSGQERRSAARALSGGYSCDTHMRVVFKSGGGTFLVRSYTLWRFSTDCR